MPYDLSRNANVRAFLDVIADAEGAGYGTLYGGRQFDDFSRHPGYYTAQGGRHSVAGRYQFKLTTWQRIKNKLGLEDFRPENQDAAAIEQLRELGALGDILNGNVQGAIAKARGVWPSLPGGSQQTRTLAQASSVYARNFLFYWNNGAVAGSEPGGVNEGAAGAPSFTEQTPDVSGYFTGGVRNDALRRQIVLTVAFVLVLIAVLQLARAG